LVPLPKPAAPETEVEPVAEASPADDDDTTADAATEATDDADEAAEPVGLAVPDFVGWAAPALAAPPAVDGYSLRLVARRRLYDLATHTAMSPSMANMAQDAVLKLHPAELSGLGIDSGSRVNVTSSRGTTVLAISADSSVPRGVAFMGFNQPGVSAADLISSETTVTEIRIETR
ncbi:MAG: hypothetical protein KDB16_11145, partial [Acidimicrobiales bacterium]|nr:hypothetical protein [Acidimicrobiales bacterium]